MDIDTKTKKVPVPRPGKNRVEIPEKMIEEKESKVKGKKRDKKLKK